jgi:hypothetical protein
MTVEKNLEKEAINALAEELSVGSSESAKDLLKGALSLLLQAHSLENDKDNNITK